MSQHDMTIANQGFPAFRSDLNNALQSLASTSSGATAPATTFANQLWYDTTNDKLKIRNEANSAWIEIVSIDQTTGVLTTISGTVIATPTVTGAASFAAGSASAPAITATGDTNTGVYFPAADQIGFATNGSVRLTLTTSQFTATLPWRGQAGTAAAPALSTSGDTNTGVLFPAADTVALATGGSERLRISSAGEIGIGGANYGTSGQVLTSGGSGAAPTWSTPATASSGQIYSEIFAATGSWTAPTGVTRVRAIVVGGGGGGSTSTCGTYGGHGGVAIGVYTVTPGTSYSITIGTGGGATGNTATAGGTTSFASFCSATGGAGGTLYNDVTCGAGTGGTLRNSNSPTPSNNASYRGPREMLGILSGHPAREQNASGLTAAIAFSTSLNWAAGAGGQSGSSSYPNGGVGGAVLLEWVQ